MEATRYYLNGDFDVTFTGAVRERLKPVVEEMTLWFAPVAGDGDAILSDIQPSDGFLDYLQDAGLAGGRLLPTTAKDSTARGEAWGWNRQAVTQLQRSGARVAHPDLDTVRRCNSRVFSEALARQLGLRSPQSCMCNTAEEAERAVRNAGRFPLVAKGPHGNAGIGLWIIANADSPAVPRAVRAIQDGAGPLVIEPWYERILDMSTCTLLDRHGHVAPPVHARGLVTPQGASYGIAVNHADPQLQPHVPQLDQAIHHTCSALHTAGYFGPVNVDAMLVRDSDGPRLVPLVEINARWSLGRIAHDVAARLGSPSHYLLRTLGRSRHRLPATCARFRDMVSPHAYDPASGAGILLLTAPSLQTGSTGAQPHRSVFFLSAGSEEHLETIDRHLTSCLTATV